MKNAATMTSSSLGKPSALCLSRRGFTVLLALGLSIIGLFFLASFGPGVNFPDVSSLTESAGSYFGGDTGLADCAEHHESVSGGIWGKAKTKYTGLLDDKFTVAIQTYRRPKELNSTIHILLENDIPSLHEIVVVWNDLEDTPPADYTAPNGVHVRYRLSRANSLNEKLWPDPAYETKAVLLSDDDVHYEPADLDFVFQTWRRQGQNRITGAFARCVVQQGDGTWKYDFCGKQSEAYALVLTGLAFVHVSFMEYYSSEDPLMGRLRGYVDDKFNCEDIALNYVASMLTCAGPLQVTGFKSAVNTAPPQGISTKPGHLDARHDCINTFTEWFGHMPLLNTTEHAARGLAVG